MLPSPRIPSRFESGSVLRIGPYCPPMQPLPPALTWQPAAQALESGMASLVSVLSYQRSCLPPVSGKYIFQARVRLRHQPSHTQLQTAHQSNRGVISRNIIEDWAAGVAHPPCQQQVRWAWPPFASIMLPEAWTGRFSTLLGVGWWVQWDRMALAPHADRGTQFLPWRGL